MEKQDFIYVKGRNFFWKDKAEQFSGVCIGTWLNIEHFMIGMPGPEQIIRSTLEKTFGQEEREQFIYEFRKNFITEADFAFMKECGINLIRVPFHYGLFLDNENDENFKEDGFYWFDRILALCRKYHIYFMPGLHSVPGGQNPDWHSDNLTGIPQFWQYDVFRKQAVKLWGKIAERYQDEPMIFGYDILNEPFLMGAKDVLEEFYQQVTEEIRRVDENHMLLIEGDHFAMDFEKIKEIKDKNTAITFHFYPTVWEPELLNENYPRKKRKEKFEKVLKRIIQVQERLSVPVLCGEFGYDIHPEQVQKSMELLEDTLDLFIRGNISWTVWCYKDAQMLGCCYPGEETPWMRFVKHIHEHWTHYKEMEQARDVIEKICEIPEFAHADEKMKYYMQFRVRGIFYQLQAEYILLPELIKLSKEEFLRLPLDWNFKRCKVYKEYAELMKRKSYVWME